MANSRTMGAWHLADRPEIYEPMRNNTFELIVHDIDNLVRTGTHDTSNVIGATANHNQEVLRFSVNKVNIPNFTQSVIEINRGNTKVKFAGTMTFAEGSIEVIDYIGADSKSVLMAWQRLSGDIVTEAVGRAEDYKKHCTLIEYTPDFRQVRSWEVQGAWVSSVSNDEMSNEGGNDKRVVTANLVFDKAVLNMDDSEIPELTGAY